ncbi:hypothetical protein HUF15_40420 [Streptomyces samsunensis]|uniref:hypothetical protein n=1 Tax=Streptomyces malaysiensis TaxID=92644 RepID=UPI00158421AD|nr:hypothetical protein [Streptomyces samsunensis]NUH42886.1 hypothetical protein [Streptomyces samsunensis]
MSTIMTSPPPPRAHEGDSDPDMDEALRRVKEQEGRSELLTDYDDASAVARLAWWIGVAA